MTTSPRSTGQTSIPASLPAGLAALLLSVFPAAASAQDAKEFKTEKSGVTVETVAGGLAQPWSVEVLPDNAYIVTELPGNLRIIRNGKVSEPIGGLPEVAVNGQGGLLDVALDPAFATNRTLYLTLSVSGDGGAGTAVYSGVLSQDEKQLTDAKELFRMNKFTGKGQHFGSRIAIAKDGSLFFGIGDRGERDRAQDMKDHAGAILHINPDGSIPTGNPYADGKAGLPEVWSKGHRNPQGIAFDPKDGTLLTVEHGARGGDEVNTPQAGKNYGWPVITFGKDYSGAEIGDGTSKDGFEQPLYYWDPSIAPGAIAVYRGAMFPEWDGDLLVTALKYQLLARLDRDETGKVVSEERILDQEYGRIRDVSVAPDGSVLLVTDGEGGALLRLSKTPTQ